MLRAGDVIGGDFEIERQLSEGGMGSVYVAYSRSTDALRALKVMHSQWLKRPELVHRFEQEAKASGRIQSEHVVQILQHGIDAERRIPWLVMELLNGETLEERVKRAGPPALRERHQIVEQLFHGVIAAHDAGIVHRDLKPANIFLARAQRVGVPFTVKVLDFGIAKVLSSERPGTLAMGTQAWMAPEQERNGAVVNMSADVWALGLILFWLCTGQPFWLHADATPSALNHEIFYAPLPAASERALSLGAAERLPVTFDAWFRRCVHRDPEQRFQSARACWYGWRAVCGLDVSAGSASDATEPAPDNLVPENRDAPSRPSAPGGRPSESTQGPELKRRELKRRELKRRELKRSTTIPTVSGSAPGVAPTPSTSQARHVPTLGAPALAFGAGYLASRRTWAVLGIGAACAGGWVTLKPLLFGRVNPAADGPLASASASLLAGASAVSHTSVATEGAALLEPTLPKPAGVSVPAGSFTMGIDDGTSKHRPHTVTLTHGFVVDRTETTVADYRRCVRAGVCSVNDAHGPAMVASDRATAGCHPLDDPAYATYPINCVDRAQAQAYCGFAGKRLPTEAEWEYAARGADSRVYPWGNAAAQSCEMVVGAGLCTSAGAQPVGSRLSQSASPFGALDMAGNVWEWVLDDWDANAYSTAHQTDPVSKVADAQRGVLRGGAWDFPAAQAKASYRMPFDHQTGHSSTGFRCVTDQ